ncbi:hypothetical protein K431DRAFT_99046 [Polychaeton citri CBS 116435]|uniref:RBR-type E3 ubiquitin transferase n=1 Tax=Polychaeton citri CBS 116435 TaxID=1314669 RepID=A0A9P4UR44_9PEZI|nr:hypothetical protein K431DRAFT_99046 [Polychaeton citri CBS 116435]
MPPLPLSPLACTICIEDIAEVGATGPIIIDDSPVCRFCLARLFEFSIANESSFPPRWGDHILNPYDYLRYQAFNTLFLKRFEEKATEFSCPAGERVYCTVPQSPDPGFAGDECQYFIGRLKSKKTFTICGRCKTYTCLKCKSVITDRQSHSGCLEQEELDKHHPHCVKRPASSEMETEELETAFQGLQRGKDYQICPNAHCSIRVELAEACNHLTCPSCKTEFCFLCGCRAVMGKGHWAANVKRACPLYGRPRKGNAISEGAGQARRMEDDDEEGVLDDFGRWQFGLLLQEINAAYGEHVMSPPHPMVGKNRTKWKRGGGRGPVLRRRRSVPRMQPREIQGHPSTRLHSASRQSLLPNSSPTRGHIAHESVPDQFKTHQSQFTYPQSNVQQENYPLVRIHDWLQEQSFDPQSPSLESMTRQVSKMSYKGNLQGKDQPTRHGTERNSRKTEEPCSSRWHHHREYHQQSMPKEGYNYATVEHRGKQASRLRDLGATGVVSSGMSSRMYCQNADPQKISPSALTSSSLAKGGRGLEEPVKLSGKLCRLNRLFRGESRLV